MAKNQNAATDGTEGQTEGQTRSGRSYIVVPLPENVKQMFTEEAKAADVPVGPYVARQLAQFRGFELPVITASRRRKYANAEEAAAAQKAARQERSSLMKQLLAEHKARMLAAGANGTAGAAAGAAANAPAEPVTA